MSYSGETIQPWDPPPGYVTGSGPWMDGLTSDKGATAEPLLAGAGNQSLSNRRQLGKRVVLLQ